MVIRNDKGAFPPLSVPVVGCLILEELPPLQRLEIENERPVRVASLVLDDAHAMIIEPLLQLRSQETAWRKVTLAEVGPIIKAHRN